MTASAESGGTRLSIDIEPELQRKIETAAAQKHISLHDYVVAVLHRALVAEEQGDSSWAHLSARSFVRDWASEEDQVYDRLP